MFRSRLKSLVKRASRRENSKVGDSRPSPSKVARPAAVAQAQVSTGFGALARAASEGTLDEALDRIEQETVEVFDNESSNAFTDGQVLTIDQDECISCGTCVENSEPNFHLPSEGPDGEEAKAEVVAQSGHFGHIQDAIDACPVMCIDWLGQEEVASNHSAGGR